METIISPSILSADFSNLASEIKKVEPFVPWLHLDIMDGHFVPNITFGIPVVKAIRKTTALFLDTHLMIDNPIKYVDEFCRIGCDLLTIHVEASGDKTLETLKKIKENNKKAGISIKPSTPVEKIEKYIDFVDLVLVMTVEPGFSGQKFIESAAGKISQVKKLSKNENLIIQVDGGINDKTGAFCRSLGANALVAGNYIYCANDIKQNISLLKQ